MARDELASFEGPGLHTGALCRLDIRRARPGSGIRLRRVDRAGAPIIPVDLDSLDATDRRTQLRRGEAVVSTVEHLLAALSALGLWDVSLDLEGPEIPILDGSARPFVDALGAAARAGEQRRTPWQLRGELEVSQGRGIARAEPADRLEVICEVRFDHPAIGRQRASWDGTRQAFIEEIAPARTFGFEHELATLRAKGLIAGGSLSCALVYGLEGPVNSPRFADEVARHKLLDAVGDLALLGRPINARITLEAPGHSLTTALARKIAEEIRMNEGRGC